MSPSIGFDKDALKQVAAAIYAEVQGREIVEKLAELRTKFDWNPFDDDGDEFVGAWAEIRQNFRLIGDVAMAVVHVAERVQIAGVELNEPQKHAAAVQVLDDIVRLPWYAEPFDGPVMDMVVSTAVAAMNSIGWTKKIAGEIVNAETEKLDMTAKVAAINPAKVDEARAKMHESFKEIG
jgi:hypothetical protein